MKRTRSTHKALNVMLLTALLGAIGCTVTPEASPGTGPQIALAQSDTQRDTSPAVDADDLAMLVAGNQAFALDLYRTLAADAEGNLFLSPHSISVALAMAYAGARGATEAEMAQALHFTLAQDDLHAAFNQLDLLLSRRGQGAEGADGEGFRLHSVNAIWGQQGYDFLDSYLDLLARHYGAGMRLVDFMNATEAARQAINEWVAEQTEGRIEELVPKGAVDRLTTLVLTNAIYFNAAWAQPFDEEGTQDGDFVLLDGGAVRVPMMRQTSSLAYVQGAGYQAIELPYDGQEISMVILLPDSGGFEAFEQGLDPEGLDSILDSLSQEQIELTMPRFEVSSEFSLPEALSALGITQAFGGGADFSGIDGTQNLFISDVLHKAFVTVDEAGTEAAAATAVVFQRSAPARPIQVTVDRPFIFLIRDIETGALLFVGRTLNPAED